MKSPTRECIYYANVSEKFKRWKDLSRSQKPVWEPVWVEKTILEVEASHHQVSGIIVQNPFGWRKQKF